MKLFGKYRFDKFNVEKNDKIVFACDECTPEEINKFRDNIEKCLKKEKCVIIPSFVSTVVLLKNYHLRLKK